MKMKLGDATEGDFQTHNDNLLDEHLSEEQAIPYMLTKITAPCPYCKESNDLDVEKHFGMYFVTCENCGAAGPTSSSRKLAIYDYNTKGKDMCK